MPLRKVPLVKNEIYHIINRGIAGQPIFLIDKDYKRFIETFSYYKYSQVPLRYSFFERLTLEEKSKALEDLQGKGILCVEIIAFCLMPNHVHFLLKQKTDNGISQFMRNITDSYTKYFNLKNKRFGPIFQGRFKAVYIESDEQLLHISRYIHLNPYSGSVIKTLEQLIHYPYSSLGEYLGAGIGKETICTNQIILENFKRSSYKDFVLNQAEYQKELQKIKHLTLE